MRHATLRLAAALAVCCLLGCGDPGGSNEKSATPNGKSQSQSAKSREAGKTTNASAKNGAATSGDGRGFYALLVGCSQYEQPGITDLPGAANDLALFRKLLVERFDFPAESIVELADSQDEAQRPTRANIEREFQRLAEAAQADERVVIYLSGHGTWQPDDRKDPQDLEEDGRDEVFCPVDAKRLRHEQKTIENGITDDELRAWLAAIVERGALVWFVVDSCHSGTIARAGTNEVVRSIQPQELLPEAEREKEEEAGVISRGKGNEPDVLGKAFGHGRGRLTMLYASQPFEETVESLLPADSPEARPYGLFTFTLCQTLIDSEGITYREAIKSIHARYQHRGGYPPTPLAEGDDLDIEVLGSKARLRRTQITLQKDKDGRKWKIDAGALNEITEGSVLAVLPPAEKQEQPLGHVRVTRLGPLEAVVEPCEFAGSPVAEDFPEGSRCEVVHIDFGLRRLKLAADVKDNDGQDLPTEKLRELRGKLAPLRDRVDSLINVVDDPLKADWLVRVRGQDLVLIPAANVPGEGDERDPRRFGPILNEEPGDVADWLGIRMPRIARAENLIRLAASSQEERLRGRKLVNVEVELLKFPEDRDTDGQVVRWEKDGFEFTAGDRIGFRITNKSRVEVDVCLLSIDSAYGIQQFFPEPGTAGNRLRPLTTFDTLPGTINADTVGLEHLAVIAVKAIPQTEPLEFTFLEQETMEQSRKGDDDRIPEEVKAWDFPLARLLLHVKDTAEGTRGLTRAALEEHSLKLLSWRTETKE